MATIIAAAGAAGNWTVGTSWVGGVAPTAADDAQITVTTTSMTIDTGAVCRSADFTGCTGTITHTAGVILTIGDGTAGASSIALKLVAGMTYTLGSGTTSSITFASTSTTLQTVALGGKTCGNFLFNGIGGKWALTSAYTSTGSITVQNGEFHHDGTTDNSGLVHSYASFSANNTNTKVVALGTSSTTITGAAGWVLNASGTTWSAGAATITFTGAAPAVTFGTGIDMSATTVNCTGSGEPNITSVSTFTNFNRTGTAAVSDGLRTVNMTVTGTLTLAGNSTTNRLLVHSSSLGTVNTFTTTNAPTASYVDFKDINFNVSRDLSAITGNSGDCGGNGVNLTLTPAATQTWNGTSGGNWSANAWTTRIPLPQDDAVIASAFSASQTITINMPRAAKSITMTGSTGTPTLTNNVGTMLFGGMTLITGMVFTTGAAWTFQGRGASILTSAGKSFSHNVQMQTLSGSMTLADAFVSTGSSVSLQVDYGTFNSAGFNITLLRFDSGSVGNLTRAVNLTGSTVEITGATVTSWNLTNTATLTLTTTGSTIYLSNTSATGVTFVGGGQTYNILKIAGTGTGAVTITGANTFSSFSITGGTKSVILPGSTTTTFTSGVGLGNTTNVITFTASAGSATVAKSGGGTVVWDYVNLTNIPASAANTFYASTHSTDGGGNTNWLFTDVPPASSGVGTAGFGGGKFNFDPFGIKEFGFNEFAP